MTQKTADFTPLSFLRTLHLDPTSQRAGGVKRGHELVHRFALHAIESQKEGVPLSLVECADVLRFLGKASARNSGGWSHDDVHAARGYQAVMEWLAKEVRRNAAA